MKILVALVVLLGLVLISISVYGLVLAFKASVILGVLVLFIEPSPFIFGLIAILGHPELAQKIVQFFN